MKLQSSIGWCDVTSNAVIGCSRVSEGCRNCYARNDPPARVLRHRGVETFGPYGERWKVVGFDKKLEWLNRFCICARCHTTAHKVLVGMRCADESCAGTYRRIRNFADSNSDFLDINWPAGLLPNFLKTLLNCQNVDHLLLTKRAGWFNLVRQQLDDERARTWFREGSPPKNLWFGVSAENHESANRRIPMLLDFPAARRFVSFEPLLGPVNFLLSAYSLDWVIVGSESGPNASECRPEWIADIITQCRETGIPVYVKPPKRGPDWPVELRVREFPR